jgi:hypothetical protein
LNFFVLCREPVIADVRLSELGRNAWYVLLMILRHFNAAAGVMIQHFPHRPDHQKQQHAPGIDARTRDAAFAG